MTVNMTVKQLKQLCGALNLTGYSRLRRNELIELCEKAEAQSTKSEEKSKTYTITSIEDGRPTVTYASTPSEAGPSRTRFCLACTRRA